MRAAIRKTKWDMLFLALVAASKFFSCSRTDCADREITQSCSRSFLRRNSIMATTDGHLAPPAPAGPAPVTQGRLLDFPRDPLWCMRRLYEAHGEVAALEEDGQRLVFAFGPEFCQQVLSDTKTFESRFCAIRGPKKSSQRRLTCGLLNMNGEEHKRHRRLVMGPFQKKALEPYYSPLVELAQELAREWQPGEIRNIFQDMTRYMLRVTSTVLFGVDVPPLAYDLGQVIERWMAMNHEVGMGAFISDPGVSTSYGNLLTLAEALEEKTLAMIDHRRSSDPGDDVLSRLIQAHDENGLSLTDAELVGQTVLLFGAAHLTTANTLTWTLFLLAQHPQIASELAAELAGVLAGHAPTLEQLEQLPLLERVIQESMRLLPASAYSHRVSAEPVTLGPLRLAKGTPVIFSQIITHHLPHLFPEPRQFRPERWQSIAPSPYAYFPFAAGPRKCIGVGLAMLTLKITLGVLLQRHHLGVVPGAAINGKVSSTMLNPTSGMPMRVLQPNEPFSRVPVEGNIHDLVTFDSATAQLAPHRRAA
jgi:cytochrome P450